jgi:hypothetical protein
MLINKPADEGIPLKITHFAVIYTGSDLNSNNSRIKMLFFILFTVDTWTLIESGICTQDLFTELFAERARSEVAIKL